MSHLRDDILSHVRDNRKCLLDETHHPFGYPGFRYSVRMPASRVRDTSPPPGARKLEYAAFVRQALETARTTRAWNGSEVARRTGVSRQTINRWVRGDWQSDPEPERVVAFCEGLGLDPAVAFTILEWGRPAAVEPAALDPDIAALLRRWADPNLTEQERFHIRETVRYLAYRPGEQRHAS
jgi:transcriptional regulator with XRE-family HTH domain